MSLPDEPNLAVLHQRMETVEGAVEEIKKRLDKADDRFEDMTGTLFSKLDKLSEAETTRHTAVLEKMEPISEWVNKTKGGWNVLTVVGSVLVAVGAAAWALLRWFWPHAHDVVPK